jgi:hypothetical protein
MMIVACLEMESGKTPVLRMEGSTPTLPSPLPGEGLTPPPLRPKVPAAQRRGWRDGVGVAPLTLRLLHIELEDLRAGRYP